MLVLDKYCHKYVLPSSVGNCFCQINEINNQSADDQDNRQQNKERIIT